jgi:hypothetical protein
MSEKQRDRCFTEDNKPRDRNQGGGRKGKKPKNDPKKKNRGQDKKRRKSGGNLKLACAEKYQQLNEDWEVHYAQFFRPHKYTVGVYPPGTAEGEVSTDQTDGFKRTLFKHESGRMYDKLLHINKIEDYLFHSYVIRMMDQMGAPAEDLPVEYAQSVKEVARLQGYIDITCEVYSVTIHNEAVRKLLGGSVVNKLMTSKGNSEALQESIGDLLRLGFSFDSNGGPIKAPRRGGAVYTGQNFTTGTPPPSPAHASAEMEKRGRTAPVVGEGKLTSPELKRLKTDELGSMDQQNGKQHMDDLFGNGSELDDPMPQDLQEQLDKVRTVKSGLAG